MSIEDNILIAECTAYDFKGELEKKKIRDWLKSISAFANSYGGSLFYGKTWLRSSEDPHPHVQTPHLHSGQAAAALLVPEENDIPLPERCRRVNEWCLQLGWCAYTTRGGTRADTDDTDRWCPVQAEVLMPGPIKERVFHEKHYLCRTITSLGVPPLPLRPHPLR